MVLLLKSNEKISFSLIIKYMNNFKDNFNNFLDPSYIVVGKNKSRCFK